MSVVRINAINVPAEHAETLVERFAARAGEVAKAPGFEAFELLRPTDDRGVFYVYTRWASAEDFDAWVQSEAFAHGHREARSGPPIAMTSELLAFDVVQEERV